MPDGHSIHFGPGGRIELVEASGLAQVGETNAHTMARGYFADEVHLLQNPDPTEGGSTSMLGPPDSRSVLLNGGRVILGFADEPTAFDWGVDIPPDTGLILVNVGIEVEDIHFGFGFAANALSHILTAKVSEAHIAHTVVASPAWSGTAPKRDAVLHFYALDAHFRSDSSVNINANDDLRYGNLGVDAVFFIPRNMRERKAP